MRFEDAIGKMWKNAFQKCEKMVKNVGKQEITCFNTFPNLN